MHVQISHVQTTFNANAQLYALEHTYACWATCGPHRDAQAIFEGTGRKSASALAGAHIRATCKIVENMFVRMHINYFYKTIQRLAFISETFFKNDYSNALV